MSNTINVSFGLSGNAEVLVDDTTTVAQAIQSAARRAGVDAATIVREDDSGELHFVAGGRVIMGISSNGTTSVVASDLASRFPGGITIDSKRDNG
jgi:hypothetical protein